MGACVFHAHQVSLFKYRTVSPAVSSGCPLLRCTPWAPALSPAKMKKHLTAIKDAWIWPSTLDELF